jgi:putative nucleotidyltransferase-like protein
LSSWPSVVSKFPSPEWATLLGFCSLPPVPGDASFDAGKLVVLAEAHGMVGQLATNLARHNDAHGESLQNVLRPAKRARVLATMPLIAELFRVVDILAAAKIETVAVKGPVLAERAFGDSSARQYGDVDFLLRSADISRASQSLVAAGFLPSVPDEAIRAQKDPGQYMFRRGGMGCLIELHTERTLRYFPRPLPIGDFFIRKTTVSIDGRAVPVLALEDEFVLISIHGAKHFWERLMWISDVAALVHSHPQMDWARVRQTAADVGAERMVRVALLLAERLLQVPIPAEMKKEVDTDTACLPIVKKIETWLPYAGQEPPALMQRALFRFRMRGHLLDGARYVTRLSLSTTEEDWSADPNGAATSLRESLRRPFRLAKKYRRRSKEHTSKKPG